jgi:hypothetical protein
MIVLLGGPKELDGRCVETYPSLESRFAFKADFHWIGEGGEHMFYFSFTEGGRDYYVHESEVKLHD